MADEARPPVAGLAKAFAEFSQLPDLLQAAASGADDDEAWAKLLEAHGFNDGHVHPGDLEDVTRSGRAAFMARDARRLCERLELLTPRGLTEAGQRVAGVAATPIGERPSGAERAAAAVVGEQIRRHYVGANGLALVPLVQQASAEVAAAPQPLWADLPGLLLVEFGTLLYRGLVDAERALELVEELPHVRTEVAGRLERGGLPRRDFGPGTFADAIAFWHGGQDALGAPSTLTLTELRVTAMAMTWSGLLDEEFGDFEVSFLVPVAARAES